MRKLLGLLLLAWLLPTIVQAQQAKTSFTLEEAQAYALENGYSVVDKKLEFEKAKQTIRETAARGLPQITANGRYTWNAQIAQTPLPDGAFGPPDGEPDLVEFGVPHQTVATLSANQLIFDGSYFVALQATRVFKDIANLDRTKAEITIKKDVANAYYGVLVTQETRSILEENQLVISKNYEETKKLFENGFAEEQDVDQLELLKNRIDNSLSNTIRQEELALQLLKFNMGVPLTAEITLSSSVEELGSIDNVEDALLQNAFTLEDHIDYRISQNNFKAASLQLKNERASYLPSVSAFAQHTQSNFMGDNFNAFNYDVFWVPATAIGLSVNWNLFTGLSRTAKVQKAKIDVQRTELANTITKSQLELNYEQAKSNYKFALANYETQKNNVKISMSIRDKTLLKYQEGLSSSLELTQTENQHIAAQQDYLNAVQNLLQSKENLIAAKGKI